MTERVPTPVTTMVTTIVVVTHPGVGESLSRQAELIIGHELGLRLVAIGSQTDPDAGLAELAAVLGAPAGGGVLILTDLPGATPHNLAMQAARPHAWPVVSGLNLPMLLKVLNHADKPARELAALAHFGGRQGILCT
jgi:mannose/fructose-specific phosphotransferase system component IIA